MEATPCPRTRYHTTITEGNTVHETFQFILPSFRLLVTVTSFLTKDITSHMGYMQSSGTVIFRVSANVGANASSDTVIFSVSARSAIFRPRLLKSWNKKKQVAMANFNKFKNYHE
jgi:hypothetical protein